MNMQSIGIIDSGVGGISVWQEVKKLLPHLSTIYIADSKNLPYGVKNPETIFQLSLRLVSYLESKGVICIVLACNTMTVVALERLRTAFPALTFVGTVPVVKTLVKETTTGKIGILSTEATASSSYQKNLIEMFAKDYEVTVVGTNELVPMVERGEVDKKVLREVLHPFREANVDVLALGCTHFPFLYHEIKEILGANVAIFDSGSAIARQVSRLVPGKGDNKHEFFTTGDKKVFEKQLDRLLAESISVEVLR